MQPSDEPLVHIEFCSIKLMIDFNYFLCHLLQGLHFISSPISTLIVLRCYAVEVDTDALTLCVVFVRQGNFKMRLSAQQMVGGKPVCQLEPLGKKGSIRVKPTTFNAAANVDATILCPSCECEKVHKQIDTKMRKTKPRRSHVHTCLYSTFIPVFTTFPPVRHPCSSQVPRTRRPCVREMSVL